MEQEELSSLTERQCEPAEIVLREYQSRGILDTKLIFSKGEKRVMVMSPTGSGKGIVMADIIRTIIDKGNKVLIIVDAISLIDQFSAVLDKHGFDHHIIQANHWRSKEWLPVHLASAQTLARRKVSDYDLIIVDEAHIVYESTRKILKEHNSYCIGFSATPFHSKGKEDWHNLVVMERMDRLMDAGFLSEYQVYAPPPPDLTKVKTTAGDFNQKDLAKEMDRLKITGDVVESWKKHANNRLTMCFGVNIAHSKHLCEEFVNAGVNAIHIDSWDDPEVCQEAIRQLDQEEITVLCSVAKLIKGFDQPKVQCIVDAAPTKSLMRHIQKWGRGLRPYEGKEICLILDHAGNLERNGYCEDIIITDLLEEHESKSGKIKREKPLPKPCTQCGFDSDGAYPCPMCGFMPEKINEVIHEEGELTKVDKVTSAEKRNFFAMLLHYSRDKGYSDGWAAHKFKEKFNAWPHKKAGIFPIVPSQEVLDFITYLNIKNAKGKKKQW